MKSLKNVPVYIIVVPLFIVIALIYGGVIQRFLPAVSSGGTTYTDIDFNYYYYTEYLDFTDENYDDLEELGLDTSKSIKKQDCPGYGTWQDYFRSHAMDHIMENEALLAQAEADGYVFTEKDMAPYEEELAAVYADVAYQGTTLSSYVQSYYDTSMTESCFLKQLERDYTAAAYRDVMLEKLAPSDEEAQAAVDRLTERENYSLANVAAAWFAAPTDRSTGEFTDVQYSDLEAKSERFLALWQEDPTEDRFLELCGLYSESDTALYEDLDKGTFGEEIESWCFDPARQSGDTFVSISEDGMYILCWLSEGTDADLAHMKVSLAQDAYEEWLASVSADFDPKELFGMSLAM